VTSLPTGSLTELLGTEGRSSYIIIGRVLVGGLLLQNWRVCLLMMDDGHCLRCDMLSLNSLLFVG
jgi:hypothetical protein